MKIDFHKLIELLLPTFLRSPRILALLRVLVAKPLQRLFVPFYIWRTKSRYESSVTPQVCSLIHAIERTFDCVAEITELDGKPYDFLVSIDRSADLNAIREFIDKHKLAGKSYIFRLGDAAFSATWLNHVDEHLIEEYATTWIEHVDASEIVCYVDFVWNNLAFSDWPDIGRGRIVRVISDKPVTSDLDFTLRIEIAGGAVVTETITLSNGKTEMMRMADNQIRPGEYAKVISVTVTPEADNQHFYYLTY